MSSYHTWDVRVKGEDHHYQLEERRPDDVTTFAHLYCDPQIKLHSLGSHGYQFIRSDRIFDSGQGLTVDRTNLSRFLDDPNPCPKCQALEIMEQLAE